jgi:hypothetical protein
LVERGKRHRALCRRCDQDFAFAVVDDVCDLVRSEKGIDTGVIEASALAGRAAFGIADVVLHEDCVMTEPAQAESPQQMREPVAPI